MTTLSKIRKKSITALKLAMSFDLRGIADRFGRVYGVYGNPTRLAKARFQEKALEALDQFLFSGGRLGFDTSSDPEVTIVIVLWNKGELTYQCLQSLSQVSARHVRFSLLIIDNGSTDITGRLLSRVDGADIVKNSENVGFLRACNQARDMVAAPYVLFLNNDTIVHPGAVEAALLRIKSSDHIGAVGARIVLPDGRLQEAGNILWSDGTCQGYLRGMSATTPEAMFARPTDYCSGAFLLTRTELFKKFGGFDERYLPAYYEETDYCTMLWQAGFRVVYEPRAAITHFEFGSAELSARSFELMAKNRVKFLEKHQAFLAKKDKSPDVGSDNVFKNRVPLHARARKKILYIEDLVPNKFYGAGFPRSNKVVNELVALGYDVTVLPASAQGFSWTDVYCDLPAEVEVAVGVGLAGLASFLERRAGYYDAIWICRPDNFEFVVKNKGRLLRGQKIPLIYDGEAIFSDREQAYYAVHGRYLGKKWLTNDIEFALAREADAVVAVSEAEARKWREGSGRPTYVVGHEYKVHPTNKPFSERKSILFVGSFHGEETPNGDALAWFLRNVMPLLKEKIGPVKLSVVGFMPMKKWPLLEEFKEDLILLGKVDDLSVIFDDARVVVIPTRFASGIPQKAFDAAECGVPIVCTDLIARQMEWNPGVEALIANVSDAEAFAVNCAQLYSDQRLWENVRANLLQFMKTKSQTYSLRGELQRGLHDVLEAGV